VLILLHSTIFHAAYYLLPCLLRSDFAGGSPGSADSDTPPSFGRLFGLAGGGGGAPGTSDKKSKSKAV
jgi:hypothetical protein